MSQERRQEIVDAARRLVERSGIESISVRSVAREAGIGASTLRHYFPTQADLFDVLIEPALERMLPDLRIADRRVAPRRRLTECLMQYFPGDFMRTEFTSMWFSAYAAAVGPSATEHGTHTLERMSAVSRDRIESWLVQLESEGALLVDRGAAMLLLLTVLDGMCVQLITPGTIFAGEDVQPTLEQAVNAVVR
ncbi:transcriptional regulator [Serinicoccus hydrothermalis]|uniref:Transcriptional regulator n=1 Tax=Serinicoccus hydrothermalis TaxID=1758689 RepID=A0A1B1NDB1_9MICO|nr:TetR/AcrR family transcriptional regulator [Serinicoccus hydrothermalis]ANS79440.1 transcriptional regulator [Serinicoccus hydrothermalis]